MRITATPLPFVFELTSDAHLDARGSFQRLWCAASFARANIDFTPHQISQSRNIARHTLRGLHWQAPPDAEQKLVRCTAGQIWDVALDLRADSPSYLHYHAVQLCAARGNALFIPRGVAHGFLTLTPNADIQYIIDAPHQPNAARGARWDDAAFAIVWPHAPTVMSDQDLTWADFVHV
jgi:dTDP-4-dehydrorhamnose 3,5-epimerase